MSARVTPSSESIAAGSTASASEPTTGTITNQTRHEPAVMIMAYFRPMIYPRPSTAAEVFSPKTTLNLSAANRAPFADARRDRLGPQSERTDDEVVQSAHESRDGQQFGLRAALLARDEDLGGRRGLGEGIFAVHLLDEVFAEGDQQHDAQQSAEQRRKEHLPEGGVEPQDVERRQREDRPGDDHARRGADRLDDDVLSQHVLFAQHRVPCLRR